MKEVKLFASERIATNGHSPNSYKNREYDLDLFTTGLVHVGTVDFRAALGGGWLQGVSERFADLYCDMVHIARTV